jgi:hypothetical protein
MDPNRMLEDLTKVAQQLGIEVRSHVLRGFHASHGGLCRINGRKVVLLNSKASVIERGTALAEALAQVDLQGIELDHTMRDIIEHRGRPLRAMSASARSRPGLAGLGAEGKRKSARR